MPIDATRFGVGHRRAHGPAGSRGVEGQVIHGDARGTITELAFGRGARLEPHDSPNSAWLCVIEGGGWVGVGDERIRVAAGEAVAWPAGAVRAAWTEQSTLRAVLVELAGPDDAAVRGILEVQARPVGSGGLRQLGRGEGSLAPSEPPSAAADREGEPL